MNFFDNIFKDEKKKYVSGLNSELKAIYIYNKFLNTNESIIIVTSTLFESNQLYKSISCYTDDVLLFPMDDFLMSEAIAISPELKNNRVETLNTLLENNKKIIVTNLMGYLRYLPSKNKYEKNILDLKIGNEIDQDKLLNNLVEMGYERNTIVEKTGDIAVRGFIIDIFPPLYENPIRIEFFGDEIDSIREFDLDTQLKIKNIDNIKIEPCSEMIGIDRESILTYLSKNPVIFFDEYSRILENYKHICEEIIDYNKIADNIKDSYMHEFMLKGTEIYLEKYDNLDKATVNYKSYDIEPFSKNLNEVANQLQKYLNKKYTLILCLDNKYQINKITDNIHIENIVITNENEIFENKLNIIIKNIENGFIFNNYIVISENEIFNKTINKSKYKNTFKLGTKIRNLNKLQKGDYVVHNIHGIGRYVGITTLTKNSLKKDYLIIEYRDGDKLYIPVEKIELISKYSSNDGIHPRLNKLGTSEWAKTKKRVKAKLENIAGELLELYAKRQNSKGFAFNKDDEYQIEFENEFVYEDTVDQRKVTEEIKRDMESSIPMDRLLCGDVGYGKTEVAFRAMFKAALSGKQVAYLCPTTILSNQHYNNAIERFKSYPVTIECLNRFTPQSKKKEIIEGLQSGKVDIVIGTHRILSNDIVFKDLGLLVIDEEQRFGVKHKEKIKQMKNNIDVLTLSATPIPRTLQMSMVGIRNLSLIETPPVNRYPIQTYVLEQNDAIIKDAIYKELSRNGQIFILYNHVDELEEEAKYIQRLVPEAKITFAHGRMDKRELENIMNNFTNNEFNVLLCTTIIETGIDIPNVNTLIIMDADRFGLSQLYQIRGRVGRGNVIAYSYLMYQKGKTLTDVAEKRLNVIKEFTELGSGFAIAMRDLSIRGAGDILGSEQAGFIDSVGIELYLKMLNEEVEKLKGNVIEEIKDEKPLIDVSTTIDDKYANEEELKIEIHQKINQIVDEESFLKIKEELTDRFGTLDDEVIIYMYEQLFENKSKLYKIHNVRQTNNFIEITFKEDLLNEINPQELFVKISALSRMFRMKLVGKRLVITLDTVKLDKHYIYYLLDMLKILDNTKNQ